MTPANELDRTATARLDDARTLLAGRRYDGAVYVCGYAVEVALKARICRTLGWSDFPSTRSEFQNYQSFRTHELEVLLHLSGHEERIKEHYFSFWNIVAVWKVESRYSSPGSIQPAAAQAMIEAAEELLKVL